MSAKGRENRGYRFFRFFKFRFLPFIYLGILFSFSFILFIKFLFSTAMSKKSIVDSSQSASTYNVPNGIPNGNSTSSSSISRQLISIDDEVKLIDGQLKELKQTKRKLLEKRDQLIRLIGVHQKTVAGCDGSPWESENFAWSSTLRQTLARKFKMNEFRELQLSVINACLSGEDAILIMSTGGGKSLCYQLPAVISDGVTLVVSPLISLMEDQLMALDNLGVEAVIFDSRCTAKQATEIQNAMLDKSNDTLKLIYVTPEKISKSKRFMAKLEKCYESGRLKMIAVDEVHCCSQWGHDFRPDYKFLNLMKRQFPNTPLLGLTATAGANVIEDVKDMLNIPAALVFRAGFNRKNLFYEVRSKPAESEAFMADICDLIKGRFHGQSGIVYCFSRKESEEVAKGLKASGINTAFYHADVDAEERSDVHRKWISNDYQVIVATVAFGMGIDKPDVRFVIHQSLPKSMDNYYQESGRAGRDNQPAVCLLYYRFGDIFRQSTAVCKEKTGLENLYEMVAYCRAPATECRRVLIAKHFAETWDRSWCAAMCDHCQNGGAVEECVDVAEQCRTLLDILDKPDTKLTALKLAEALMRADKKSISRERAERIIVHLLLEGFLKENFHFTPYNVISYLVAGRRAAYLKHDDVIFMNEKMDAGEPPVKKRKSTA